MDISEFQDLMRKLYFQRDAKRGVSATYEWFVDEVKELGEALTSMCRENVEEEFADVIAWTASLANVLGIDLEEAALKKYNRRCPKCGTSPCSCPFSLSSRGASAPCP